MNDVHTIFISMITCPMEKTVIMYASPMRKKATPTSAWVMPAAFLAYGASMASMKPKQHCITALLTKGRKIEGVLKRS